ncbi:MAG: hypothetical protein JWR01_1529, partial [Subtercola sp.]|nr:hypothetical protein [Subtercola sp.]
MPAGANGRVIRADNLDVLPTLESGSVTLIYLDPPFNTGRVQRRQGTTAVRAEAGTGSITGFKGNSYER